MILFSLQGEVPTAYTTACGSALGKWVNRQRNLFRDGKLKIERQEVLESVGLRLEKNISLSEVKEKQAKAKERLRQKEEQAEKVTREAVVKGSEKNIRLEKKSIEARKTTHFPKAIKPSPDCKLGLRFIKGTFPLKVSWISPESIFVGTELAVGMVIEKINGKTYNTHDDGMRLLKGVEKTVKVTASMLHPSALPSPWRQIFDRNTERTLYYNPETRKSQKERPTLASDC